MNKVLLYFRAAALKQLYARAPLQQAFYRLNMVVHIDNRYQCVAAGDKKMKEQLIIKRIKNRRTLITLFFSSMNNIEKDDDKLLKWRRALKSPMTARTAMIVVRMDDSGNGNIVGECID
ncbi:hypothetical protein LOAG_01010 [Loa loa]|uniref:DUF4258 domain-containing protein n=1 Tax=Loa loa TaxID=7209 RepID=A0A1I7VX15_LOALO|nr:hypothetical protein LOAG_01010 [Loa loa]EFO27479.1 hypothetical protein LOAG_01010 [Loa loa]